MTPKEKGVEPRLRGDVRVEPRLRGDVRTNRLVNPQMSNK